MDIEKLRLIEMEGLKASPRAVWSLKPEEFQEICDAQIAKVLWAIIEEIDRINDEYYGDFFARHFIEELSESLNAAGMTKDQGTPGPEETLIDIDQFRLTDAERATAIGSASKIASMTNGEKIADAQLAKALWGVVDLGFYDPHFRRYAISFLMDSLEDAGVPRPESRLPGTPRSLQEQELC